MPLLSPAQKAEVNRQNAAKSTGPTSVAGKNQSRANALKHGFSGGGVVLGEDEIRAVDLHTGEWVKELGVTSMIKYEIIKTGVTAWVLSQSCMVRIARLSELQAKFTDATWDVEHEVEAWDLGQKLQRNPAKYIKKLRATKHGCQWLIESWRDLLLVALRPGRWKQEHTDRALSLRGRALTDRDLIEEFTIPSFTPNRAAAESGIATAIQSEIQSLIDLAHTLDPADQGARALAREGVFVNPPREVARLERYLARLTKTFENAVKQMKDTPRRPQETRRSRVLLPVEERDEPPVEVEPAPDPAAVVPEEPLNKTDVAPMIEPNNTLAEPVVRVARRAMVAVPTDVKVGNSVFQARNRHERRRLEALARKQGKA
ncbi:MAG: hypothetical protein KGM43_14070 [Planctomycetota bacterium]|nr:hypothetical protein [Planctomycetota bacterium]